MRRDPANVLQLLGDAVESMLDGYDIEWLRDEAGGLCGFQVKLQSAGHSVRVEPAAGELEPETLT